ncbi:glutamate--tRNA ligase [bacterium]|nr:glutamate--tRNA ligase [bacterium]
MAQNSKMIVRFAPSPTGYLHIGGARTALFNYLLARHNGGRFLLRIEDTDRERSTEPAVRAILEGLAWLGLEHDGEIVFQSLGFDRHRADAARLLESGAAYRCFCTQDQIEARRAEKNLYIYDRKCAALDPAESARRAAAGESFAVRFRVPAGETVFEDMVHGSLRFDNKEIEDFVILRSDGTPTYQLAVVSDDIEMGITHILRGDDHVSNTPKQILLYRALGRTVPVFGHVPLILGPDKKRLSKRHGATSLTEYRDMGFLAPALFNFLALLGWSPGEDREILSRQELVELFSVGSIGKKSAVFDQAKLEWMNGQYLSALDPEVILPLVEADFRAAGLLAAQPDEKALAYLKRVLALVRERCRFVRDFAVQARCYFPVALEYDPEVVAKRWSAETPAQLTALREALATAPQWQAPELEAGLRAVAEKLQVSAGKLIHPLRLALTGAGVSPGIFEVLELLGRELSLARIAQALERLG